LGPGMPWGSPGLVFGQGELTIPPIETGVNFGGVWQPPLGLIGGSAPTIAWGLVSKVGTAAGTIQSIRALVKTWKSAGTYYPNIIVSFDSGNGAAGNAYSPNSATGSGNPDGSFGSPGKNVGGVWVPTRTISSLFDCYCQGTGVAQYCSLENVT
jgi:hypothetical protein